MVGLNLRRQVALTGSCVILERCLYCRNWGAFLDTLALSECLSVIYYSVVRSFWITGRFSCVAERSWESGYVMGFLLCVLALKSGCL